MPKATNISIQSKSIEYLKPEKINNEGFKEISIKNNLDSTTSSSNKCARQWNQYYISTRDSVLTWINDLSTYHPAGNAVVSHKFTLNQEPITPSSLSLTSKNRLSGANIQLGTGTEALAFCHYQEGRGDENLETIPGVSKTTPEISFLSSAIEESELFKSSLYYINKGNDSPYQYYKDIRDTDPYSLFKSKVFIISFLKANQLLSHDQPKNKVLKEHLIPAIAKYIYREGRGFIVQQSSKECLIAKNLVSQGSFLSNAQKRYIASQSSQAIISNWLFFQVLGMSPGQFIANKINSHIFTTHFNIGVLKKILSINQLIIDGLLDYYAIPADQWGEFNVMWYQYLGREIPMLKWFEGEMNTIALGSHDFADLYTGTMVLNNGGYLRERSLKEIINMGKQYWLIASNKGIDLEKTSFYTLPSFIVLASNKIDFINVQNNSAIAAMTVIEQYLQYRKATI